MRTAAAWPGALNDHLGTSRVDLVGAVHQHGADVGDGVFSLNAIVALAYSVPTVYSFSFIQSSVLTFWESGFLGSSRF